MATEKQIDQQFEKMVKQALHMMPDGTITIVKRRNHIILVNIEENRESSVSENKRPHLVSVSS